MSSPSSISGKIEIKSTWALAVHEAPPSPEMVAVTVYVWVSSVRTCGLGMVALLNPVAGCHCQSIALVTSTEASNCPPTVEHMATSASVITLNTGYTVMVISSEYVEPSGATISTLYTVVVSGAMVTD